MKKPTILITNDDGIFAPGIRKLIDICRKLGKVIVVAPDSAMSGMSHAITVKTPLRLKKLVEEKNKKGYVSTGTWSFWSVFQYDTSNIMIDRLILSYFELL